MKQYVIDELRPADYQQNIRTLIIFLLQTVKNIVKLSGILKYVFIAPN